MSKPLEGEYLEQCPKCLDIKIKCSDGRVRVQKTFVVFTELQKELCYQCGEANKMVVDNGITSG